MTEVIKMDGFTKFDKIIEVLGIEETLQNLLKALSEKEKQDNANYIARMWNINLKECVNND
jgi:ABC-type molybdate transport system ATPase subunit